MKRKIFRNRLNHSIWFENEIISLKQAVGELSFHEEQFEEIGIFDLEEVDDYNRFLELVPYYDDIIEEEEEEDEEWD